MLFMQHYTFTAFLLFQKAQKEFVSSSPQNLEILFIYNMYMDHILKRKMLIKCSLFSNSW